MNTPYGTRARTPVYILRTGGGRSGIPMVIPTEIRSTTRVNHPPPKRIPAFERWETDLRPSSFHPCPGRRVSVALNRDPPAAVRTVSPVGGVFSTLMFHHHPWQPNLSAYTISTPLRLVES